MKKLVLLLALLVSLNVFAHGHGIKFFHGTYKELLKEAKKQNKKIFIDFYTKWCGPCKVMAKNEFTKEEVGDFFNKHFISYKVDAEVGEGPELAKLFGVKGYPTLVFVDANGKPLIDNPVGAKSGEELIKLGKAAMGEKTKDYAWYKANFEKNRQDSDFLKKYYEARFNAERLPMSVEETWEVYSLYPESTRWEEHGRGLCLWNSRYGNEFYNVVKKNKDRFPELKENKTFASWYTQCLIDYQTENEWKDAHTKMKQDFPKVADQVLELYTIEQLRIGQNPEPSKYIVEIINYANKYGEPDNFSFITTIVALRAETIKPEHAKYINKFFRQNLEEDPTHFFSVSGYAYLLSKAGEKEKAKQFAIDNRKLTEQYKDSKKMAWSYNTMRAIEKGEEVKPFKTPGM